MKELYRLDEITCNDLNIQQLYSLTNFTNCRVGGEYLYNALKHPLNNKDILIKREELCQELYDDKTLNTSLDKALSKLGNDDKISVYSCIDKIQSIPSKNVIVNIILALILAIVFILMLILDSKIMLFAFILMVPVNMIYYFSCKNKITEYINVFKFIINLLNNIKYITKIDNKYTKDYIDSISKGYVTFKRTKRLSFCLLAGRKATGGFIDLFLDYFRMLFHIDIIKFYSMLKQLKDNKASLILILDSIGELDLISSIVKFRESLPYYCKPHFCDDLSIECKELYHPYIKNPVENNISTNNSILITGSNATGKSTFIRSIGVNAILAQTLNTSTSKGYTAPMFKIYSSMMITDNILNNESYFVAELKAIKRMTDLKDDDSYKLFLIDELLKGTNSKERITASYRILKYLAKSNTLCFVATHDGILTQMLDKEYENYYFNEQIVDDQIKFDYKLKKGICNTTNALALLKTFDFPKEIWQE